MAARCLPLRAPLRPSRPSHLLRQNPRLSSTTSAPLDVAALLSKPTWSVASLLPRKTRDPASEAPAITPKQLHHLLRLSALPQPASPAEETDLLASLSQHLHFVKEIQSVDTTGVSPLQGLRDETKQGEKEQELGLERLKEALGREKVVGSFHRRVRRVRDAGKGEGKGEKGEGGEEWDVLGTAGKKVGRFFVVEGGKREAG